MPKRIPARKKKPAVKIKLPVYIIIFVILVLLGLYLFKPQKSYLPIHQSYLNTRNFHSDTYDFTIEVPTDFEIEERFTTIIIKKNNQEIFITYSGMNYSSLNELFLKDKDLKNRVVTFKTINNMKAAVEQSSERKSYYIYKNHSYHSIFTYAQNLFPILDQIAHSFRYTPD